MKQNLEAKNWGYLESLGSPPESANIWISLFHHACPQCGGLNTLTAKSIHVTRDAKGNSKIETRTIVDKLLVTPSEIDGIRPVPNASSPADSAATPQLAVDEPAVSNFVEPLSDSAESSNASAPPRENENHLGF